MSLADKLGNIYADLNTALNDANSALVEKGVETSSDIYSIGNKIRQITDSNNGDVKRLVEGSILSSNAGYDNLIDLSGISKIKFGAFAKCYNVLNITIPDSVTIIDDYAFYWCDIKDIIIPDTVTVLGKHAFEGCSNLTSVVIGNGIANISDYAFSGCTLLSSITIPNSVTSIGDSAFELCSSLLGVTIGNGVTSIGDYVFRACGNLSDVYIHALTPPTLGSFAIRSTAIIHVPIGSGDAYKSATNWSTYADNIVEDIVVE